MKILLAVNVVNSSHLNPYVQSLAEGLITCGHHVVNCAEAFWSTNEDYDIVHIHWPQALFGWQTENINAESVARFRDQIQYIQDKGGVVCYTRHNAVPHADLNPYSVALHDVIERMCDVMIHMGNMSLNEVRLKYRDAETVHCIVPHHAYDWYNSEISQAEARCALSLAEDVPTVLSFGEFRSKEERLLLAKACAAIPEINVLSPLLFVYRKGLEDNKLNNEIRKMLGKKLPPQRVGRIHDKDLPTYFMASDVVFIQRLEVLNSGNLPLAFHFGKVVVGPDSGNVGEILRTTGNPVFDVKKPETVIAALQEGLVLSRAGKGVENKLYAREKLGVLSVVSDLLKAYKKGLDKKRPSVSVLMPSLNTAQYIRKALDSIVNQTMGNIEVVCIDAGSSDGTREIILEYVQNDKRVCLIDSSIKSYGYQMNLGIKNAKGRYIAIVEPDDYIKPEMCEELYSQAILENLDIIKGNCVCFQTEENGLERRWVTSSFGVDFDKYGQVFNPIDCPAIIREGTLGTTLGLYRRDMLLENNIRYNESMGAAYQDTGFFFQTMLWARRFKAVRKSYYNYRQDNPASSRNDKSKLMVLWSEYEFVLQKLSEFKDKCRASCFEPYILGRLFSGQVWMIRRIGYEKSGQLVEIVKNKFLELYLAGYVRKQHLPLQDWNTLVSWTKNCIPASCNCKISVVMPCFNVSAYVAECLDSVLHQTLLELECLCVDDGSTDDTISILKNMRKKIHA